MKIQSSDLLSDGLILCQAVLASELLFFCKRPILFKVAVVLGVFQAPVLDLFQLLPGEWLSFCSSRGYLMSSTQLRGSKKLPVVRVG